LTSTLAFYTYNLLLLALSPVGAAYLGWRTATGKQPGWAERLGYVPVDQTPGSPRIWLHAVSAGEVAAAAPLLRELLAKAPDARVYLSTITSTGRQMVASACGGAAGSFYFPLDTPGAARRALSRVRPDVIALVEGDVWPNFVHQASLQGVPVVIVNGRVSDRGYRRARYIRPFLSWALRSVRWLGAQTELDAERLVSLGAPRHAVTVVGNTKFDANLCPLPPTEVSALRSQLGIEPGAPVLVAGSTRPGEEEQLLRAYKKLLAEFPNLRLVIAPRHVERTTEIESLLKDAGCRSVRRSSGAVQPGGGNAPVVILDTMGELASVFAVATVAFVGGSLVPIGGHNILQPIAQGKPVMFGPHVNSIRGVAAAVVDAGVGFMVADGDELASRASELLADPVRLDALETACIELMERNRGAAARYADAVLRAATNGRMPLNA